MLLYGKLVKKKGKRTKSHNKNLTKSIFGFILTQEKSDILRAVTIFLSKYKLDENTQDLCYELSKLPFNKMLGLCYTIKLIFKHLGRLVDEKIPFLGKLIIAIMKISLLFYQSNKENEENICRKTAHTIYSEAIKRLKDLYTQFNETEFLDSVTKQFIDLISLKLQNTKSELAQGKSNILSIFQIWANNPSRLHKNFVQYPIVFYSIISLLSAPKLVSEVGTCIMQILYSLIFTGEETRICNSLFEQKIDSIIDSVYIYLENTHEFKSQNFEILSELAIYLKSDSESISKLIILLAPHMNMIAKSQKQGKNTETFINLLHSLKALFEKCSNEKINKIQYLTEFSPLLIRIKSCILRYEFSLFLQVLGKDEEYSNACEQIVEMNKTRISLAEIEPDFDKIINSMNKFNSGILSDEKNTIKFNPMQIVLYNYLAYLNSEEYSMRSAASHGIKLFLSNKLRQIFESENLLLKTFIIERFIPTMRHLLKNKEDTIFRSGMEILREYLIQTAEISEKLKADPDYEKYHFDLRELLNIKDEEQDFFYNIAHTQMHRRFKALRQAGQAILDKKISVETQLRILIPLCDSFLFQEEDEESMRKKVIAFKKSGFVRQAVTDAIELIGNIIENLNEMQYFGIINRYTIKLKKLGQIAKEITQGVLINVICKILDKFPFKVPNADEILNEKMPNLVKETKNEISLALRKLYNEKSEIENIPQDIFDLLSKLRKNVFPILKDSMTTGKKSKEEEGERHRDIKPQVAIALIRIIKKLPVRKYIEEYEKIVTILIGPLRSKDHELRDKVRGILYEIIDASSPYTLHIILNEMTSGLKKDYQRHILLYTTYGIFQRIIKLGNIDENNSAQNKYYGKIDHCIPILLPLIMKGVIGELADEAETEEVIKQCKEAKNPKAAELYGLLAQLISMSGQSEILLGFLKPLISELETTNNTKHIHKCELALSRISDGLLKNPNLSSEILISMSSQMIEKGLNLLSEANSVGNSQKVSIYKTMSEHKAENYLLQEGAASGKRVSADSRTPKKNEIISGRAISSFGFSIIYAGISRGLLELPPPIQNKKTNNEENKQKLQSEINFSDPVAMEIDQKLPEKPVKSHWFDSFIPYILTVLKSSHTQLVQIALKIYDKLLDREIPKLQEYAPELLHSVIKQFDYLNMSDQEMVHCVFRCITHIIESHHTQISLEKSQIDALLVMIKANMREVESQVPVFKCVKSIIANIKEKLKNIQEIIEYVSELMVTAFNKSVREICGSIFYEYTTKRLKITSQKFADKIQFVLRNLNYEDDDLSRLFLLEALQKLTTYIIQNGESQKWIDQIFISLVLRLANEENSKCKKQILLNIELILQNISKDLQKQLIGSIFTWMNENSKPALKMVSFQLCGVLSKVLKDSFVGYLEQTINEIEKIIGNSVEKMINEENELKSKENIEIHEEIKGLFKSMKLLENEEKSDLMKENKQDYMLCYMALICLEKLLENIKGHLFSYLSTTNKMSIFSNTGLLLSHRHYWIKMLSCRILGHYFTDNSPENIVFIQNNEQMKICESLFNLFKSQYLDESLALQTTKNILFIIKNTLDPEKSFDLLKEILIKATILGKSCISGNELEKQRLKFIIRLIGGLVLSMSDENLTKIITQSLSLIYRISTNERYKGSEQAKLCYEIIGAIEKKVGNEKFTEGMNKLKTEISLMKTQRKEKLKQIKITNPDAAIRQKLKLKEKQKEKRRKKNVKWAIKRKGAVVPETGITVRKNKLE